MRDDIFSTLMEILKILEACDFESISLEDAIIKIIDRYNEDFTEAQKAFILKEFLYFEKRRRGGKEDAKEKAQREAAERFARRGDVPTST